MSHQQKAAEVTGWVAWIMFAGLMLLLLGGAHITVGTLALFRPESLEGTRSDQILSLSLTALGWFHLIFGVLLMVVGAALTLGQVWGRVLAIVLACLSLVVNFAYADVYPIWSVVSIALSVVVLYAVAAHGRELTRAYRHE